MFVFTTIYVHLVKVNALNLKAHMCLAVDTGNLIVGLNCFNHCHPRF